MARLLLAIALFKNVKQNQMYCFMILKGRERASIPAPQHETWETDLFRRRIFDIISVSSSGSSG